MGMATARRTSNRSATVRRVPVSPAQSAPCLPERASARSPSRSPAPRGPVVPRRRKRTQDALGDRRRRPLGPVPRDAIPVCSDAPGRQAPRVARSGRAAGVRPASRLAPAFAWDCGRPCRPPAALADRPQRSGRSRPGPARLHARGAADLEATSVRCWIQAGAICSITPPYAPLPLSLRACPKSGSG
jgi:hypothetical protein